MSRKSSRRTPRHLLALLYEPSAEAPRLLLPSPAPCPLLLSRLPSRRARYHHVIASSGSFAFSLPLPTWRPQVSERPSVAREQAPDQPPGPIRSRLEVGGRRRRLLSGPRAAAGRPHGRTGPCWMFRGREGPLPPQPSHPVRGAGVGSNGGLGFSRRRERRGLRGGARPPRRREALRPARRAGAEAVGARTRAPRTRFSKARGRCGPAWGAGVGGPVRTRARVGEGAEGSHGARARPGSRGEVGKARLGGVRWSPRGGLGWVGVLPAYDLVLYLQPVLECGQDSVL